jgi:hypothetical protein
MRHVHCIYTWKNNSKAVQKKSSTKEEGCVKKRKHQKNKLGVKNSLVNNISAKKEEGTSKTKKKSAVSKKAYKKMEDKWGKEK